jgi:hypothetical protein
VEKVKVDSSPKVRPKEYSFIVIPIFTREEREYEQMEEEEKDRDGRNGGDDA